MSVAKVVEGTATAALATAVITPPTAPEWKQLGFAVLSAVIVAAVNVFIGWLRARVPPETPTGGMG